MYNYCPHCGSQNIELVEDEGRLNENEGVTFIADDTGDSVEYFASASKITCSDCNYHTIVGKG